MRELADQLLEKPGSSPCTMKNGDARVAQIERERRDEHGNQGDQARGDILRQPD
jgi:hypothetical protein